MYYTLKNKTILFTTIWKRDGTIILQIAISTIEWKLEYRRPKTFLIIYFSHSVSPPNNTIRAFTIIVTLMNLNLKGRMEITEIYTKDNNNVNRDILSLFLIF